MSAEDPNRQRRMGDENFDEMVEALKFKRDQFLAAKEREEASPDEALVDWAKVTSSWRNRMATCVTPESGTFRVLGKSPLRRAIASLSEPSNHARNLLTTR